MSASSTSIPPASRRILGAALRRYRENLGLGLDDTARFLECDRSKVSRIETGQRGIRAAELRLLLTEYGIGDDTQDALAAIAQPRGAQGWWRGHGALPAAYAELFPLEAAASQILVWEPQRVPDLLQTPEYARALATAGPSPDDDATPEDAAAMLADRQHAILDERKSAVTALIAESTLRQPVADPRVVQAQIVALAVMADNIEHVTICLLPTSATTQSAATDPAIILRFGETPGLAAAHLPGPQGGIFLDQPADVAACTRAFEQLRFSALTPEASARRMRELARRYPGCTSRLGS
jgi:transcriptional regulator with XRE-family HTH domain